MLASIARFCVRRRRWVLAAWMLLFIAGITIGMMVFGRLHDSNGGAGTESVQGFNVMQQASSMGPTAVVLVKGPPVTAPGTRAAVIALTARLEKVPLVTGAVNVYTSPATRALRSPDGHASVIVVSVRKDSSMMSRMMTVTALRSAARHAVPGATVQVGGDLGVNRDGMVASQSDLFRGEAIALPVLLIALFFIFRGWRAALLPLAAALATVSGALILLMGMTHVTDVAPYSVDVITLFGLALAVDYSLLMVNRFREARAAGADVPAAVEFTAATAGRTVTFSALTVAAALSGLLAFGDPTFTSVAVGGIATVLVALATAVTLIPALLAAWGPKLKMAHRQQAEDGFFGRLARRVQRRPVLAAAGVSALLLAAALPFLHASYGLGDPRTLPQGSESRQVALALYADFPGLRADPVTVVAKLPASDPRIPAYAATLAHLPGAGAVSIEQGLYGNVSAIDVIPAGTAQGGTARHLVTELREHRPAFRTWVTGQQAFLTDFKATIAQRLPYALAIIGLATFVAAVLDDRVGAHPGQGPGHEHPVARRHLRRAGLDLPGRAPGLAARLHRVRRDRGLDPGHRVRLRVRAVHGLRGVPAVPDQGVPRRRLRHQHRRRQGPAALREDHHLGRVPGHHRVPRLRLRAEPWASRNSAWRWPSPSPWTPPWSAASWSRPP